MGERIKVWAGILFVLVGTFGLVAGCNTGNRSKTGTTNPGPGPGPGGSATTLTPSSIALSASLTVQRIADPVVAMVLRLSGSAGPNNVLVNSIELSQGGTVGVAAITSARLIVDANGNGLLDAAENTGPALAQVGNGVASVFSGNPARLTFTPAAAITIAPNTSQQLLVVLDLRSNLGTGAASFAAIGSTVQLSVSAIAAVNTASPPVAVTAAGVPLAGPTVTMQVNDHLLISEIFVGGAGTTNAYIEICNPTAQQVALQDYHLTDFTAAAVAPPGFTNGYFQMPIGTDVFGGSTAGAPTDFSVRFPAGATINARAVITVAVDGAGFALANGGQQATFCLRNPGAGPNAPALMRTWDGVLPGGANYLNFVQAAVPNSVALDIVGETITLYRFQGANRPDLVEDVDIVNFGANTNNPSVSKTGISVDGADGTAINLQADSSMYRNDTTTVSQDARRAPVSTTQGIRRTDFSEGAETRTNGNGITANDETSEVMNVTFQVNTPSPNAIP